MCCDCGGGFSWDRGSLDEEWDAIRSVLLRRHGKWTVEFIWLYVWCILLYDESYFVSVTTTPTLPLLKCVVLVEAERREFARTWTTEPRTQGYSCVDVAIAHNHGYVDCKSDWDTPTFTASSMCCACGGGRTILPTTSSETCEHTSGNHVDIEGDTCTHYLKYHLGQGCDGSYDDDDFTASEMCCGCGDWTSHQRHAFCVDTEFEARDSRGKRVLDGNYDSGNICGLYDDDDFTANQMCCDCGGFSWERLARRKMGRVGSVLLRRHGKWSVEFNNFKYFVHIYLSVVC